MAKRPGLAKGIKLVGFSKTLERGDVAVYRRGNDVWVADAKGPLDVNGVPMGMRDAPVGILMTALGRQGGVPIASKLPRQSKAKKSTAALVKAPSAAAKRQEQLAQQPPAPKPQRPARRNPRPTRGSAMALRGSAGPAPARPSGQVSARVAKENPPAPRPKATSGSERAKKAWETIRAKRAAQLKAAASKEAGKPLSQVLDKFRPGYIDRVARESLGQVLPKHKNKQRWGSGPDGAIMKPVVGGPQSVAKLKPKPPRTATPKKSAAPKSSAGSSGSRSDAARKAWKTMRARGTAPKRKK